MASPASDSPLPPAPARAVFLSYAREDTDAARRIADALRAFGVDVWFDQSELRGGDTWDAKIKKQIRDCTLFLPVVSAQTQQRTEGYFRREWKLAVERTHDMAAGKAFIVPVVIDETREADAAVPEEFMRYQWTRLAHGMPTPEFVGQVRQLLAPRPAASASPCGSAGLPAGRKPMSRLWLAAAVLVVVAMAGALLWRMKGESVASSGKNPVIVLMDSTFVDRVYDPITLKNGGSNADDITDILRGLPVSLVKEATSAVWRREAEVVKEHPALIVMHRSCFYTFPGTAADDFGDLVDNKLVAFLGYVATVSPETRFIIYSRHSWEVDAVAAKWREDAVNRFPVLAGKLETWRVPLDRATFRNPLTAQELKTSVERTLGFKSGPATQK
jgi:hypothetical protein